MCTKPQWCIVLYPPAGVSRDGSLSPAMAGPCREPTLRRQHERCLCAALHASGTRKHTEGEPQKPQALMDGSCCCCLCFELMCCSPWWQDLAVDLQGRQKQVNSLQDIASELLLEAGGEDSTEAKEKLHVIGSKLRLLSRQVEQDLQTIQERLVRSFCPTFCGANCKWFISGVWGLAEIVLYSITLHFNWRNNYFFLSTFCWKMHFSQKGDSLRDVLQSFTEWGFSQETINRQLKFKPSVKRWGFTLSHQKHIHLPHKTLLFKSLRSVRFFFLRKVILLVSKDTLKSKVTIKTSNKIVRLMVKILF